MPRLRFEAGARRVHGRARSRRLADDVRIKPECSIPSTVAVIEFGFIPAILAHPAYQALRSIAGCNEAACLADIRPLDLIGRVAPMAMALPLSVVSGVHLYAGRLFLKAGSLSRIGIELVQPPAASKANEEADPKRRQVAKEAA